MVQIADAIKKYGHEGWIHDDYRDLVSGKMNDDARHANGESADIKRERDYFRLHYRRILESDAIIVVNNEYKGVKGYIGGNVLIEMGQAYVNDKKIFLLYDAPTELAYVDEIKAMDSVSLGGNIANIMKY